MLVYSMSSTDYAAKTKRQSIILLSFFISFDIFFLISGIINLSLLTPSEATEDYLQSLEQAVIPAIIVFFSTSLICNRLELISQTKS
jgi:hypothetical protein